MSVYDFGKQLVMGQDSEQKLDQLFGEWYKIAPATQAQQRVGIDRVFTRRDTGKVYRVEYKTDKRASQTGNAFIETASVDVQNKPGWAHSSQADILIYYVLGCKAIYIVEMPRLRQQLATWQKRFPERAIPNRGYFTRGILVSLDELEKIALNVLG